MLIHKLLELSKSDEGIKPFVLACEAKNPKLVPIAINCLQRLIMHQAVPENSTYAVIKALSEHALSSMELQLKILQSILPLTTSYKSVTGDALAEAMILCYKLQDTRVPVVNSTATATFRQLIVHSFEKVSQDDVLDDSNQFFVDAINLFQDICLLTAGEAASFLRVPSMSRAYGLELIESVLSSTPTLFKKSQKIQLLLKDRICPLVIKSFSEKNDFSITIRLIRLMNTVIRHFHSILSMECEIFLSMYIRLLDSESVALWQQVLVLEAFFSLFSDASLQRSIFQQFDSKDATTRVYHDSIISISKIVFAQRAFLLGAQSSSEGGKDIQNQTASPVDTNTVSLFSTALKIPCIEQLEKTDPPSFPDTYIIHLAVQCIFATVENISYFILPILETKTHSSAADGSSHDISSQNENSAADDAINDQILLMIEMTNLSSPGILPVLTLLLNSLVEEEAFIATVNAFQSYTVVAGLLGLTSHRDAFIGAICKACFPFSSMLISEFNYAAVTPFNITNLSSSARFGSQISLLSDRNIINLKLLLSICDAIAPVMDNRMWFAVFETLQIADGLLSSGKTGKRMESSAALLDPGNTATMSIGRDASRRAASQSMRYSTFLQTFTSSTDGGFASYGSFVKKSFERTASMELRQLEELVRALCRLSHESMAGSINQQIVGAPSNKDSAKVAEEKSFAVAKLHEVTILNVKRLIAEPGFKGWDLILGQWIQMVHNSSCSPSIRAQVCNCFGEVLVAAVQVADLKNQVTEAKILEPVRTIMALEMLSFENTGSPSDDREKNSKLGFLVEVHRSALETLNKLLQISGQNFINGWALIFDILQTLIQLSKNRRPKMEEPSADSPDGASIIKSSFVCRIGFPSVQLICTDFLSLLSPIILSSCIQTVAHFGSLSDDLNISLTSVGLLWTICDYILTKRQELEQEQTKLRESLDGQSALKDSLENTNELENATASTHILNHQEYEKLLDVSLLAGPVKLKTFDTLWMFLLGNLSELCADSRPEVRNSANQTLFRTLAMNGQRLTLEAWDLCIWHVLFPLLDDIKTSSSGAKLKGSRSVSVDLQLSPRSPSYTSSNKPPTASEISKQWDETIILTLNGVSKCILDFLPVLVNLDESFMKAWDHILEYIKDTCLVGSPEVSLAALKNLRIIVQFAKPNQAKPLPESFSDKVPKLWDVVWRCWVGIGKGIVSQHDDADSSKSPKASDEPETLPLQHLHSIVWSDGSIPRLLHGYFTQDTLTLFILMFSELHEVISPSFTHVDFDTFANIATRVLLYHTEPLPGTTQNRMRADFINDLDQMSPLQSAVFDIVSESKVNFSNIQSSPERILQLLSDIVLLPFITPDSSFPTSTSAPDATPGFIGFRKMTYMTLTKRSLQYAVTLFERHGLLLQIYESGAFECCIRSIGVPMKLKYSCPNPGVKDSTPLWRCAATASINIVNTGLKTLSGSVKDLEASRLDSIYESLLKSLNEFLLQEKLPPDTLSLDERSADEAFDISFVKTIEDDILPHLSQSHTSDKHIHSIVTILYKGSQLYSLLPNVSVSDLGTSDYRMSPLLLPESSVNTSDKMEQKPQVTERSHDDNPTINFDTRSLGRENFGFACLDSLFNTCSNDLQGDFFSVTDYDDGSFC